MPNYAQTSAQGKHANDYRASDAKSHKHIYKRSKVRAIDFATDKEVNPHLYEIESVLDRIQATRDEIKQKQERLDEYKANPFKKSELTAEQMALIKLRFINGESPRKIAPDFGIGATKAREICELLPNYKTIAAKRKTAGARVVEKGRKKKQ